MDAADELGKALRRLYKVRVTAPYNKEGSLIKANLDAGIHSIEQALVEINQRAAREEVQRDMET